MNLSDYVPGADDDDWFVCSVCGGAFGDGHKLVVGRVVVAEPMAIAFDFEDGPGWLLITHEGCKVASR